MSYIRRGDEGVSLQLYGRTRDGRSITAIYDDFQPYFHIVEPSPEALDALEKIPNYLKREPVQLWYEGTIRDCVRVIVRFPYEVPKFRTRMQQFGMTVLAADIPFSMRFMYDKDLGGCARILGSPVEGDGAKRYTTDLVVQAEDFEETEDFKPQLKILSFDIENSLKDDKASRKQRLPGGRVFTICLAVRETDGEMVKEAIVDEDEEAILIALLDAIERHDPDVITGYNIDGYDIPYVYDRLAAYGRTMSIGRDGSDASQVNNRFWRTHGRIIADAWWNVKRELRPKRERLADVAQQVLGEQKLDVNTAKIDEEWAADQDRVVEYCIQDAVLALRILESIAVLEKMQDLATVSKLPLNDVINGRTSQLIDSIFIRKADRAGVGVPLTRRTSRDTKIEGAYVHSIQPGLYRWIVVLDFKSMYPSIIIANNMCFTTLSPDGEHVSPIEGVRFITKEEGKGLLAGILEELMVERDSIKAKMKAAETEKERAYYDGLQEAVKILMNSFYGVFASSFYRFTNRKIGESITAFARENIKAVIRDLEEENISVIYSDTDSVFIESPYQGVEPNVEFGEGLARKYSRYGGTLEFEKILDPFFTHGAKKRYVGHVLWPEDKVLVRGYETRRTDAFDYQVAALEDVFDRILDGDTDSAIQISKDYVEKVRNGDVETSALVISRSVKDERAYANPDGLVHVRAAKKLKAMGEEFVPGMKVSYVIVQSSGKTRQEVEPWLTGKPFEHKVDYEYYARRVAASLARVT
ncbi:MAG: DNA polymerase II, partial [Thermoplasmata archaeon]|nr:DNA polymerase II [Thermoplasmata archaeon]